MLINSNKKYKIIYIDPPWPIKIIKRKIRPNQLDMPYKTMTYEEIYNLDIHNIVDKEECHLFLWTTHKFLPKAFKVIDNYGFNYNCTITWNKTYGFTPFSFMFSTEFLLYAQLKNKWKNPIGMGKYKTDFTIKPSKHSEKPDYFRDVIVGFCGNLPRIELFARKHTNGWDCWGDEINKFDTIIKDKKILTQKTIF